jgi:hypothetical protein
VSGLNLTRRINSGFKSDFLPLFQLIFCQFSGDVFRQVLLGFLDIFEKVYDEIYTNKNGEIL